MTATRSLLTTALTLGLALAVLAVAAPQQKLLHLPLTLKPAHKSRVGSGKTHGVSRALLNTLIEYNIYKQSEDVYIMTELHLGSDKTPVQVGLDSGSSHLYVINKGVGFGGFADDWQKAGRDGNLSYLDGSVRGRYGFTSIWVAGQTVESKNHEFLAVDSYDKLMETNLLGLAKGYDGYVNIFDKFKENGLISESCFAITPVRGGLKLIVGGLDESLIKRNSVRADVPLLTPGGGYFFELDSASFGDVTLIDSKINALLDTGNTFISFPESCREKVLDHLHGLGLKCFTIDEDNPSFTYLICEEHYQQLPDFRFVIRGETFEVKAKDLKIQCIVYSWDNPAYKDFSDPGKQYCEYRIEFEYESEYLILGKAFIQLNYVTFYQDRNQVTIIQNKD